MSLSSPLSPRKDRWKATFKQQSSLSRLLTVFIITIVLLINLRLSISPTWILSEQQQRLLDSEWADPSSWVDALPKDPMEQILRQRYGKTMDILWNRKSTAIRYYVYDDDAIDQPRYHSNNSTEISRNNLAPDAETDMLIINALKSHPLRTLQPENADLFIIPLSTIAISANGANVDQSAILKRAFSALKASPWFQRNHGNDHVMISTWYGRWEQRMYTYTNRKDRMDNLYNDIWNVTMAAGKDRRGIEKLFREKKHPDFQEWFRWERLYMSRASFSLGNIPVPDMPLIEPTYEKFLSSNYSIFYHIRPTKFHTPHSTEFRRLPLQEKVIKALPNSSIGNDLEKSIWMEQFTSSKFCLVVRGDDPKSHSLLRSVKVGCIPVVISDAYPEYAPTLRSSIRMEDYCIFIPEKNFWSDTLGELQKLEALDREFIEEKLLGLAWAQRVLLPDHPYSLFVPAFLREAVQARKYQRPETSLLEYNWHHSDEGILRRPYSHEYPGTLQEPFYVYGFDSDNIEEKDPKDDPYTNLNWLDFQVQRSSVNYFKNYKHSDDYWLLQAARRHRMRTYDPEKAKLFFVPTLLNAAYELPCITFQKSGEKKCFHSYESVFAFADAELAKSKYFQRYQGRDHVIVASHWKTLEPNVEIPNIRRCNIINFEDSYPTPIGGSTSLPSMYVGRRCESSYNMETGAGKTFDLAMVANLQENSKSKWKLGHFRTRRNICKWIKDDETTNSTKPSKYSVSLCGQGDQCPALAKARYGFHVRGDTWGSQRPMDSLLSRTIPLFTDKRQYSVLPPIVPWEKLSYLVNATTRQSLHKSLDTILARPESEYREKQRLLEEYLPILDHKQVYQFDAYMTEFAKHLNATGTDPTTSPLDGFKVIPQMASCLVPNKRSVAPLLQLRNQTLPRPYLNMGMPRVGTNSLYQFFLCGGYKANLWRTERHGHTGLCMRDAQKQGHPILESCSSWWSGSKAELENNLSKPSDQDDQQADAFIQMDVAIDENKCLFPQMQFLDQLHEEAPNATFILMFQPVRKWAHDLVDWNPTSETFRGKSFAERLQDCDLPGLPYGTGGTIEELEQWFCDHVTRVRQFVADHPSHKLIELDIRDDYTNTKVMSQLFGTQESCWKRVD